MPGEKLKILDFLLGCCIIEPVKLENKAYVMQRVKAADEDVGEALEAMANLVV